MNRNDQRNLPSHKVTLPKSTSRHISCNHVQTRVQEPGCRSVIISQAISFRPVTSDTYYSGVPQKAEVTGTTFQIQYTRSNFSKARFAAHCWSYPSLTCSICTDRNRRGRYVRYNRARCSRVSGHCAPQCELLSARVNLVVRRSRLTGKSR